MVAPSAQAPASVAARPSSSPTPAAAPRQLQGRLVALGAFLGAGGLSLLSLAMSVGHVPYGQGAWPALALCALFVAAESSQIHIEVRRQTWSVSLSELPLVLGLFLVPAQTLMITRLVAAGGLFALRRTNPAKTAFNLGLFAAEVGAASLLFAVLRPADGLRPSDWAAAYLAALLVDVIGSTTVLVAMGLLQRRLALGELRRLLPPVAFTGALNTTLALVALLVLHMGGGILLGVLLIPVMVAYRVYDRLLREHSDLGQLFASTQVVGEAKTSDDMQTQLVAQARNLLQGESAAMLPAPTGHPDAPVTPGQEPPAPVGPLVLPRGTRDPVLRSWLAQAGLRDAVLVPVRDDRKLLGVLQVGNRIGAMSTFTANDVELLQALVAHADVIRRNRMLLERLRHDAHHDDLTGLANRALFLLRLRDLPASGDDRAAVLLLDLDRFKEVNDTLGHHVGDLLLRQVSSRLLAAAPPGSEVARLGGDEFALLLPGCRCAEQAERIAADVKASVTGPFEVAGTLLEVGASVGIALIPLDGTTPEIVLQHADTAMYVAKGGASGVSRYRPGDERSSLDRLALAGELRRAVEAGQLTVHYQPKVRARKETLVGYEALVRWAHPHRGLLLPQEFIPIAEHTGLIGALTQEVLRQALVQCRGWLAERPEVGVAVNLSARDLLEPDLHLSVTRLLAETGVPAEMLTLEITETSVMGDFDTALATLRSLRQIGVRLSVDDFGTGYSSLAYLQRLPIQEVKIDKSFVIPMSVSPKAAAIAHAIIDLAHALELTVVAEGVEDDLSRHALASAGCDVIQGYLLSPPLTAQQLTHGHPLHA